MQQFVRQQWNEEVSLVVSLYSGCYLAVIPGWMSVILLMLFLSLSLNVCLKYAASVHRIHPFLSALRSQHMNERSTSMPTIGVRTAHFCSYFFELLFLYACGCHVLFNPLKSMVAIYTSRFNIPKLPPFWPQSVFVYFRLFSDEQRVFP